jgi:UDP-glucose:(heptosyl)LPS alpha-1,3-glucosyltransferase
MPPLRIALVRQRYTPFGGAERFVSRAMEALRRQGAEITLITRRWEPDGNMQALTCDPFYLGNLWRDWSFARCVKRMLTRHDFDLVQSHERIAGCDIYRAGDGVHREWLAQRRRVLSPLGQLGLRLNPYHRYVMAAEKTLFTSRGLRAVICNSRMVAAEIRHWFGLPAEKLHVIYSGVDTEAFHPRLKDMHRQSLRSRYGIPGSVPLFLFVGAGFQRKGLSTLLEALAAGPQEAHLLVVGKDKRARCFQSHARKLGLNGRVHFAGPQSDVKPFYGAADAFVLPTLYDPFPNVALEAMASGLPLVTSTKSGAAEFVRAGENGFVCDALDREGLAEALNALANPDTCAKLGETARKTVEPLTLDSMGSQLIDLYGHLLAPPV